MDESHSAAFEVRQIHVVNVIIFVTVIFVNVFLCLYRQSHAPVNDIVPVSYTHLDVYKRQELHYPPLQPRQSNEAVMEKI